MLVRLRLVLALSMVAGAVLVFVPAAAQAATLKASLVATRLTSGWGVPSPDPSGITWNPATQQLIISDSEVDEMPLYRGTNLFVSSLTGQQASYPGGTTLPWSKEPTGISLNQSSGRLFVSDDDKDLIFSVDPGSDGRYGTDDDVRDSFSTAGIGNGDPEDVAVDLDITNDGHILVIDGGDREIYEYASDGRGGFSLVGQSDVYRFGARDPEGIEYHPGRNTILVLDGKTQKIYEVTRRGELLNVITINEANAIKAAGIALAPASNGSGATNLYIVDRGIDNNDVATENDGRFYEMSVAFPPLGGDGGGGGGGSGGSANSLDLQVRRGSDDAEEQATRTLRGGTLQLAVDRSKSQTVGLRFTGVTVPKGATITAAYVQFQADATSSGSASLTVRGQAADNAPTFSTAIGDISKRPRTSAAVAWNPSAWVAGERADAQRTPDLRAVVQEIVSRTGWSKGNAVVLTVTGTGTRTAESYNSDRAHPPTLHIEWTV